jgi:hypothetical protein
MRGKISKPDIFLAFFIAFTYVLLVLDTIKYPGFIAKHFLVDAKVFLTVCVTLVFLFRTSGPISKATSRMNLLILVVSGFGYIFFSVMEGARFPNYVFSKFHINLEGLAYIVMFSIALFIVGRLKGKLRTGNLEKDLGRIVLYLLIAHTLIVNLGITLKASLVSDIYVALHLDRSYSQKMSYRWGDYYNYMVFVRNNTPEDANILIPPQISPWQGAGNLHLDAYFLYPRKTFHYEFETVSAAKSLAPNTYVMIYRAEGCSINCRIWPEQTIYAKEVIFMNSNSNKVEESRQNYTYNSKDVTSPFGLLLI